MNTLLRPLIVWLLLLAVPIQGMAAAAMAACAPAHGMPAAVAPVRVQAPLPPCHETAAQEQAAAQETPAPHDKAAKCGTCSACGIANAVLPARLPVIGTGAPVGIASPFTAGHLPSVHLAQPERPPRPRLA